MEYDEDPLADELGDLSLDTLDSTPPHHCSGYVALVGKPNVGKSTLLNAWLGFKIAAVSPKPQTTRNRLLGILTRPDAQVIFVDTPGIHLPRTKLGDFMVTTAKRAIPDADAVVFMVDATEDPTAADREIAILLSESQPAQADERVPVVLALNKADRVAPGELSKRLEAYGALGSFVETFALSALEGHNRDALLERIVSLLPLGPRYYPEDQLTDQQERFIAAELIREQVMTLLQQEVPHATAVLVDEFKERDNGVTFISATIYVEKETQKPIVIGRGGSMLKRIGRAARTELEHNMERRVYLELWVKVRKNWRKDERQLRQLGYSLGRES